MKSFFVEVFAVKLFPLCAIFVVALHQFGDLLSHFPSPALLCDCEDIIPGGSTKCNKNVARAKRIAYNTTMRKKAYESLHVRLDPKYKKMLKKLAKQESRTQTAVIELLIEGKYLESVSARACEKTA